MGLACTSACLALRSPGRLAICLLLGIQGALSRVLRGARPSDVYLCFASAHQFVMGPCHTPSWLLLLLPVYCSCSCVCYLSAIQEPSSRACRACRGAWTDGDASRGAEDDLPQQEPPQQQDPGQAGPSNGKGRGKRATNFSEEVGERDWGGAGVAPTSQPPARRSAASCWRAPRLPHARAHTHAHTHTHARKHAHTRTHVYLHIQVQPLLPPPIRWLYSAGGSKVGTDKRTASVSATCSQISHILLERPKVVVVDEAHEMRNPSTNFCNAINRVRTNRRIALTGYPLQVRYYPYCR